MINSKLWIWVGVAFLLGAALFWWGVPLEYLLLLGLVVLCPVMLLMMMPGSPTPRDERSANRKPAEPPSDQHG